MAPPILLPRGETASGGATYASATSAVRASDMTAIQLNRELKITMQTPNGPTTITIAKDTRGYLVRKTTPGFCRAQLFDTMGNLMTCDLPDGSFTTGAKHSEFRVVMPAIAASATHAAVGHARLNDRAGKVIAQLWANFAKNKDMLQRLGFQEIGRLAANQAELDRKIKTILGAFRQDAWAALNSEGLTLKRLLALRPVSSAWPSHNAGENDIYIRLYFHGDKSSPDKTNFAKYGGRTSFNLQHRHRGHEDGITGKDKRFPNNPHHTIARKFAPEKRVTIPMMTFNASIPKSDILIAMAETTICCLLRTFHAAAFRQAPSDLSSDLDNGAYLGRLLLKNIVDITDRVMQKLSFPLFGGTGTNWSFPMGEKYSQAREWVLHKVTTSDGKKMSTFKTMTHVYHNEKAKKTEPCFIVGFTGQRQASSPMVAHIFYLNVIITDITTTHKMPNGWPLILSVEIMDSGAPHHSPWTRLPYYGAFDNCPHLASLAIKIDFFSPAQQAWYSQYLVQGKMLRVYNPATSSHVRKLGPLLKNYVPDDNVLSAWREVTTLLQIFKGLRYRNNELYLFHYISASIKEVIYDHLAQTVTFRPMPVTEVDAPKRRTFEANFEWIQTLIERRWKGLVCGVRPGADWFVVGTTWSASSARHGQPGCLLCRCQKYTNFYKHGVTECVKRQPFPIDAAEADVDKIKTMSCNLCWRFFRAPCIWVPRRLVIPMKAGDLAYCHLHPQYDGATVADRSEFPASTIPAPMSMEIYLGRVDPDKEDEDEAEEYEDADD